MGVCQINLEELHLSSAGQVLDWYRLFSANSLMNNYTIVQQSPKSQSLMTSNDSLSSFKTNSRYKNQFKYFLFLILIFF